MEVFKTEILYQSNNISTVKMINEHELLATSIFLSTSFEAVGQLVTDLESFRIRKARWDIYRSPDGRLNGGKELPELNGVEAYFSAGKALRRVVGEEAGGLPRELLAECVKGMIQAETYLYDARGYPTREAYDEYWDQAYLNACRYYSNLERVVRRWTEHVGNFNRKGTLFNRVKNCRVSRRSDRIFMASGSFSDSFHELGVYAELDGEGMIRYCTGNFLRAPDQVCYESKEHLLNLVGKKITTLNKKEIGELVGGPQGCDHLFDIVYGLSQAVTAVIGEK